MVKPESSVASLQGEVLAVNKNDNFVIVDLGAERGVQPGAYFDIVRNNTRIGVIEVIETRREISAADIKETSSGYSIREGDSVIAR